MSLWGFLWVMGVTLGVAVWVVNFLSSVGGESLVREFLLFIEDSGLWRLFWGVEVLPPFIFLGRPGGTRSLGMLAGGRLGMLDLFPPWVFIEGGVMLSYRSSPLGSRVPKGYCA